ncbi:MAG: hypothetical protein KDC26_06565 [Armatimonadetes bacterium]|nr:hypothetical protein [Armatimonadota bacterium]
MTAALATTMAWAQPVTYTTRGGQIKAGVVVISPTMGTVAPHIWSNLDRANGVKPAEWSFVNPLAEGQVSVRTFNRWSAFGSAPIGTRTTKNFASYWEVWLNDVSEEDLTQYDVLAMSPAAGFQLNTVQREKLRKFVDKGGILWLEMSQGGTDVNVSTPLPFAFRTDANTAVLNLSHPILSSPNIITVNDYNRMTGLAPRMSMGRFAAGDLGGAAPFLAGMVGNSLSWDVPVSSLFGAGQGYVVMGKSGDGFMVITGQGAQRYLNLGWDPVSGLVNNTNFVSPGPSGENSYNSASKLAVNILSLPATYGQPAAGSRKSSSVPVTVGAPALRQYETAQNHSPQNVPVLFDGRVVTTTGGVVRVYDAKPNRDLDKDNIGNPDDGVIDPAGSAVDLVWQSQALGTLSAPAVTEVPNSELGFIQQVWVSDNNGQTHVFNLSNTGGAVAPAVTIPTPPNVQSATTAPVIHDDLVVVGGEDTSGNGALWSIDLRRPSSVGVNVTGAPWLLFGNGSLRIPTSSPAVGYIPIADSSSASDLVAYIPTAPAAVGSQPASISSIWMGAKGEAPTSVSLTGNQLTIATRASQQRLPLAGPVATDQGVGLNLHIVNPLTGSEATPTEIATWVAGIAYNTPSQGQYIVTLSGAGLASGIDWDGTATPGVGNDDASFRTDYYIDWSGPTTSSAGTRNYIRGSVNMIDQATPTRVIVGSPALTPNGFLGVSVRNTGNLATTGSGGTFYIFKEEGRGQFLVRTRYELNNQINTIAVRGNGNFTYPDAITDEDNINVALPFLNERVRDMRFVDGPAVRGGLMYVTAAGTKLLSAFGNAPADTSVLLAFDAEPGPAEFDVVIETNAQGEPQTNVVLRQPDVARSPDMTNPTAFAALNSNSFQIEALENTNGMARVILNSLASSASGTLNSCLTNNLPVIVRRGNQTENIVEPELSSGAGGFSGGNARGTFNSLAWYIVMNGMRATCSPVVTGNTVYVGGTSILPGLVSVGPSFPLPTNGLIFGFDATVAGNDPFLKSTTARPWVSQYWTLDGALAAFDFANARPADGFRWPQLRGITQFDDFRIRLLQASISSADMLSLTAGDGSIATASSDALNVFSRSDFLIVDSGRIGRFDSSGNPLWLLEKTLYAGPNQPISAASQTRRLSEPHRVYPDGQAGYVIVDSGNDAVLRIDSSGREIRSITKVRMHPQLRPDGSSPNENLQLRNPRDVLFYSTYRTAAEVASFFPGETLELPATDEKWDHYLIADGGNNRVIEVIDRYRMDAQGRILGLVRYGDPDNEVGPFTTAMGVMFWHTPEELSGKRYFYNTLSRKTIADGVGGSKTVFALGFNNIEPSKRSLGLDTAGVPSQDNPGGFGGVVLFDGNATSVINEFNMPPINAGTYVGDTGGGVYNWALPTVNDPTRPRKISGLQSATLSYVSTGPGTFQVTVMLAMQGGLFELVDTDPSPTAENWDVRWMLPTEAYRFMRRPGTGPWGAGQLQSNPSQFRPMYARRLDSGDVLMVNGYFGTFFNLGSNNPFTGEVVLVDGSFAAAGAPVNTPGYNINRLNLGFNSLSVLLEMPPIQGARGIVNPVFAERQ